MMINPNKILLLLTFTALLIQSGCFFHTNNQLNDRIRSSFQIHEDQKINEKTIKAKIDENLSIGSSKEEIVKYLQETLENDEEHVIFPDRKNNLIICKILFKRKSRAFAKKMYIIEFALDINERLSSTHVELYVSTKYFRHPVHQD